MGVAVGVARAESHTPKNTPPNTPQTPHTTTNDDNNEPHLVVEVVEEAAPREQAEHVPRAVRRGRRRPGGAPLAAFSEQRSRGADEEGDDRDEAKEVDAVDRL